MSEPDRLDALDYYTLLGVTNGADDGEVRRAFRAFARRYHPDRFVGQGDEKVARATRIYRRGSEAFQTLVDPALRRAYDEALARGELRLRTDARAPVVATPPPARGPLDVPTNEPLRSPSARAYLARAEAAMQAGDAMAARRALLDAIAQEPGHPRLERALAQVEGQLRIRPR